MILIETNKCVNSDRLYLLYNGFGQYANVYIIRPSGEFLFGYSRGMTANNIVVAKRDDTFPIRSELLNVINDTSLLYELTEDETCNIISELL